MPVMPGWEVLREVAVVSPSTRTVVLSMYAEAEYVTQALRSGALGYVVKLSGADELLKALREAIEGRSYVSPMPTDEIGPLGPEEDEHDPSIHPLLTLRERQVLQLVAGGMTNDEIGVHLDISRRTVESHRASMMKKLRIKSQAALIHYAIRLQGAVRRPARS